jgi:hypothetical protein
MVASETPGGRATATFEPAAPWQSANPDTDKLLLPASKVVPFLGGGVSAGAALPTGADIGQRLRDDFGAADVVYSDPRAVATHIIRKRLGTDIDVQKSVAHLYQETRDRLKPTAALNAIAGVPSKWVVTLCYDDSVEQAAALLGVEARPYTWKDLPPWEETISGTAHPLNVFHLHGRWQERETIILDEDTYQRTIEHNDTVKALLSALLLHHNACFVGTSFDEAYLVKFFAALPTSEPKHVFFTQGKDVAATRDARLALNTAVHNVVYEPFPDGDWRELDRLCQRYFAPASSEHTALAAAEFLVPAPVSLYVPPVLVTRAEGEGHGGRSFSWGVELGYEDPIAADELAVKSRTLIVGRPGAGKTQLLRRAAAEVPEDERAVYVRLAGAAEPVGNPVAVLVAWVRGSQAPESERPLKLADLEQQRFHFLLDGLDEVPSARQARLAARITDMARALPQHRFTVTSRPVPAADLLDAPEWERLDLITTSAWRNEYLAKAGVKRKDLLDKVPAFGDLDDLLELPFFLDAVVQLVKADQLPAHGDLMTVIQALIDRAFETPDIEPVRDAVRPWLRNVAFAMQTAGRNELRVMELKSIELPAGLNLGPDDDVLDLLSRRSLLEDTGGHVRFVHRLVADTLTAEKLVELGPEPPGLLDVVAPATEAVSGLRSDWMVVLALVGARSAEWRAAIAGRDRLAAARMVPPTAEVAERREAARTLWGTYLESRVWMHNHEAPRLLQDAEAMGRLLRRGDMPDVVDDLLGAVHHPSPQVRSNAIEVLAYAELDDDLAVVVRASLAGDSEPVVRRQAAGAARQRSLASAFPLVKQRALQSRDKLETQDIVSVALRLAPPAELVEFALEVIEAGRGKHRGVESITRERAGADAALVVMRKQAERGELSHRSSKREMARLLEELPDDDATTEQLAYIVALGGAGEGLTARFIAHPKAAARGLVAGIQWSPRRWFEALTFLDLLPEEALDAVKFDDEALRERLNQRRDLHRQVVSYDPTTVATADEPEEVEAHPTLAELLDRTDEDAEWLLIRNAVYFASAVKDLSTGHKRKLQRRVRAWWPEAGIGESITGNRIGWHAHASLAYGSQLASPLTDEEWVDVALARMPYDGKDEWLRKRYRRAAAMEAATRCRAKDAETWAHLADAIPGKLPVPVVRAMADRIKKADHYINALLARLLLEGRLPALRKLSSVTGGVGEAALYYVARGCDYSAQKRCLATLIDQLGTDRSIHTDDLGWMETIADARLLPKLFRALVTTQQHRNPDGFNDTMGPIHAAIRRIGGVEAIAAYDQLIAQEPPAFEGVHFERYQRDVLVDDLLREAGDEARGGLLSSLGLPDLDSPGA